MNCTPRRNTTYEAEPLLNRLAQLCVQVNDRLRGGDISVTQVLDPWLDLSCLLWERFAMATTKIETRTVEAVLKSHHGCGWSSCLGHCHRICIALSGQKSFTKGQPVRQSENASVLGTARLPHSKAMALDSADEVEISSAWLLFPSRFCLESPRQT